MAEKENPPSCQNCNTEGLCSSRAIAAGMLYTDRMLNLAGHKSTLARRERRVLIKLRDKGPTFFDSVQNKGFLIGKCIKANNPLEQEKCTGYVPEKIN